MIMYVIVYMGIAPGVLCFRQCVWFASLLIVFQVKCVCLALEFSSINVEAIQLLHLHLRDSSAIFACIT